LTDTDQNPLIEQSGGIRWQPYDRAIERICEETGCSEEHAREALRAWNNDGRVSQRGRTFATEALALLRPDFAEWRHRNVVEVDMESLEAVLLSKVPAARHAGGRPPIYDWVRVRKVLGEECELQGSIPRSDHSDPEWRKRAHAIKYVRERMRQHWPEGGPCDSALSPRIAQMLAEIDACMRNPGN
jgi:hypothetical protein